MLLLFLVIGYFIRKAMFVGMAWSDDYDYTQIAVMILDGRYNPVDIGRYNLYGWRFPMVFPLAFFFKILHRGKCRRPVAPPRITWYVRGALRHRHKALRFTGGTHRGNPAPAVSG